MYVLTSFFIFIFIYPVYMRIHICIYTVSTDIYTHVLFMYLDLYMYVKEFSR